MEECVSKLKAWKEGMENKGQRVNMKKTKLMVTKLMVLMFSVTLVHFHVLSVRTVLEHQSSACSTLTGCISRAELLQTKAMFAQGVVDKFVQLMAEQSHK